MLEIAQIGTIPTRGLSMDVNAYDIDIRPNDKPESTLTDGGVAFPSQQYATRLTERDIEGVILRKQNLDMRGIFDELQSMVGKPTHIVGVYPLRTQFGIDAIWLFTQGRIERIRGRITEMEEIEVTMEVALLGAWRPMNRFLWEYVEYDRSEVFTETPPVSPDQSLISPYPTWEEYLAEFKSELVFYWRNRPERAALMYDPAFWDLVINYTPNGFASLGDFREWSDSLATITIWQDATLWNHRPTVVYAIRGMDDTNDVEIQVDRPAYLGGEETITIDVSVIDTILTDETGLGLQTDDILMLGDVNGRAFIIRDGAIVAYCTSAVSPYYGEVMGYIPVAEHIDFRIYYDFASSVEWSSLVMWRKFA